MNEYLDQLVWVLLLVGGACAFFALAAWICDTLERILTNGDRDNGI